MTPRMYFTLVLRGIGIWKLAYALEALTTAWNVYEKLYTTPYETPGAFVSHAVTNALIGATLLFGAAAISAMIVPASQPKQSPDVAADGANV